MLLSFRAENLAVRQASDLSRENLPTEIGVRKVRYQLRAKARRMNGSGFVINCGIKPIAWQHLVLFCPSRFNGFQRVKHLFNFAELLFQFAWWLVCFKVFAVGEAFDQLNHVKEVA